MVEKLLGTGCFGLLIAAMGALNEDFRVRLFALADGGLMYEASALKANVLHFTGSMMDGFGAHGGDMNWLLAVALAAAVAGAAWMMKW